VHRTCANSVALLATAGFAVALSSSNAGDALKAASVGRSDATPQAAVQAVPPAAAPAPTPAQRHGAVITEYCVTCHNARARVAGLDLDTVNPATVPLAPNAEAWEKVVRKVRLGAMPPQGTRRPAGPVLADLAQWLEGELDRAAQARPNPGRPLVHRMNRTEYANAVRDLLHFELDASSLLPPDDSAYGFDNVSEVLGLSPVQVERYVTAAEYISAQAMGSFDVSPGSETYRVRQDRSQDQHVEGLPLGTVGGIQVRHLFPLDAEYRFEVTLFRTNLDVPRGLEYPNDLEITIDGERVFLGTIGGSADQPGQDTSKAFADAIDSRLQAQVPIKAGTRSVVAAFLQRRGFGTTRLQPFLRSSAGPYDATGRPHLNTLTIVGPFNPTGSGETAMRQRIFTCRPGQGLSERRCAERIVGELARRAYRRPLSSRDLRPLMEFYEVGRREGGFEVGIQRAIQRILASPKFVLRAERTPERSGPGQPYRVSGLELASRLSFFLWSSIPDDELLELAAREALSDRAVLRRQVRRMLADPKSSALLANFVGQWLQLRNLRNLVPDSERFPDFDDQLRESFARESELFFESIIREDRNILDLLTADYTFVNERLARHYGIPHVYGSHFRRVPVVSEARRGLLGHGSLLTVTSHADRTAPVLRGKWILDNLLGAPPPPPPPDVSTDLEEPAEGAAPLTVRERMRRHRANPQCASCHNLMDPIGLALENFDAVGAWRGFENGSPIDATTQLFDGTHIDGVVALRRALLARDEVLIRTITEKLMTYALGRGLQPYDMPAVRAIVRDAARDQYRFSSIVQGIVASVPFQMRMSDTE
jgi:mono/diheme cytochrome c family protein